MILRPNGDARDRVDHYSETIVAGHVRGDGKGAGMFIGFRPLEPKDERAVLDIFRVHAEYFDAATGAPSGPGDVQSLFYALPEGAAGAQKRLLAITSDGKLAGVIDAILHYPQTGTASVGVFMIDPRSALHSFGMPVAALASERAQAEGITTVHVGCPIGWKPGEALLTSLGFVPVDDAATTMNRSVPPAEGRRALRRWVGLLTPPQTY
jgi:hypothetical protein